MNLTPTLTIEQKSTTVHAVLGIAIGVLAGIMSKHPYQIATGGILMFTIGVLLLLYFVMQKLFGLKALETPDKKYGAKWYLSNGAYPYLIFWLLAWIVLYNI